MKQVRMAVIGVGMWGTVHIRAYSQHASAEIVAVCDLDETRARETAKQWHIPAWYTSVDEMLANEKLDAVSVATPDTAHTDIVVRCANAGVHVLCEKPMATTVEECETMLAAAKENETRKPVCLSSTSRPETALICWTWSSVTPKDGWRRRNGRSSC